jgi:drug/metabolite transporter (DMT)-like permease
MTEYFIILLAVFGFAAQFVFTKMYGNSVKQTTTTSLVMLVFISCIGAVMYLAIAGFKVNFSLFSFFYALFLVLVMLPYYIIGIKVISLGSLAIYSMFMMLGGMLVPFFYGVWFLNETVSVAQIIGTVLLTLFIILQAISQSGFENSNEKNRTKNRKIVFLILCMIIFFVNGLTGVIAKAHQINTKAVDAVSYTVISCALTAILSLILLGLQFLKNPREKARQMMTTLKVRPIWIMAFIGITTYTANFLHLLAASKVPASVQFPLVSGGVIVLSALVSVFLFKEKVSKMEWIAIGGAFLSTVLFAF